MLNQLKIFSPLWLYIIAAWTARAMISSESLTQANVYLFQLMILAVLVTQYFYSFKKLSTTKLNWKTGAAAAFIAAVVTPSVMQTDQLRYIWDGLNTIRGVNPYSLAPIDSPEFKNVWWVGLINHPVLPTIYPPFAEILFSLGAALNPFFWSTGSENLLSASHATNLWQVEFGHALISGIFVAWTVYILRHRSWLIYLMNPLVLITVIGNKHIDLFMLPFLLLMIKGFKENRQVIKHAAFIAIATSIKIFPIIWLPFFYLKKGLKEYRASLTHLSYIFMFTVFFASIFMPNILSSLSQSGGAYASTWHFFSIFFKLASELQKSIPGIDYNPAHIRLLCVFFGSLWGLWLALSMKFARKKPSLRFLLVWLTIGFYLFFPTLHPWYFLPLLVIALPYKKVLLTPFVWPAIAFTSQSHYFNESLGAGLQLLIIMTVLALVMRDLRASRYRLLSPSFLKQSRKTTTGDAKMTDSTHPLNEKSVALIMPCLDEEKNLEVLLPSLVERYRVVVVDNGSRDASASIASKHGAEVVSCPQKGYGRAVQFGLRHLSANQKKSDYDTKIVVIFDSDGTSPAKYIPSIIEPIQSGQADLVIGQRTSIEKNAMPIHAKFGNKLQVALIKFFTRASYLDMGPLRAMRLQTFYDIKMKDQTWGWNVEMQVKAAVYNLRVVEREINYLPRMSGKSKISGSLQGTIRAGFKILFSVIFYFIFCNLEKHSSEKIVSVKLTQ